MILLLVLALGYWVRAQTLVAVPKQGGTYVEGLAGSPFYLNPLLSYYNDIDRDLCRLVFDGLTESHASGEIVPNLALRWDLSEDGLSYTFHLREDVRWHDRVPFTARDVLFTIKAIQDPGYRGSYDLAAFWRDVKVEMVNMYTIRFSLPQPFAPFPGFTTIGLLPAHLLSDVSSQALLAHPFNASPVGTGSFRVVEMNMEHILLERNPHDYRPQPYLDRLEFKFYPGHQALLPAYRQGEIDGISRALLEDLPSIWADQSLNLYSAPVADYALVFLNCQSPLFQDKVVRQALLYATDRQALINQFLNGQGVVAHSPIFPYSWAYDPAIKQYAYDPERAAQLLNQAGWLEVDEAEERHKAGKKLAFTLLTSGEARRVKIAEELARQWAEVGIKATPQAVGVAELIRDYLKPRRFEAVLYEWQQLPLDPDPYPLWHSTQAEDPGQNFAGLLDDALDILLEEGRLNRNPEVRKRLYDQFQQLYAEEAPSLLLYYPVYHYAISRRVHNVQLGPLFDASDRFRTIRGWYMLTRRVIASEAKFASP